MDEPAADLTESTQVKTFEAVSEHLVIFVPEFHHLLLLSPHLLYELIRLASK